MAAFKVIGLLVVGLYVLTLVVVYFIQHRLIFHTSKLSKDFRFGGDFGAEEIFLKAADGETINGLFYPAPQEDGNGSVILYLHGNTGDLSQWQYTAQEFVPLGYAFCMIDYRGFGKSTGSLSEEGVYTDAEAAYVYLVHTKGYAPHQIILYGRSIGTGIAAELATRHAVKGLVLESPYASLKKLANEKVPFLLPSLLLRFRFDTISKMKGIHCPVIFIHGTQDTLIPMAHTEALYDALTGKKKKVLITGGGHNGLNQFKEHHETLGEMGRFFR